MSRGDARQFLSDSDAESLPWAEPLGVLQTEKVLLGSIGNTLEVAVAWAVQAAVPKAAEVRALWRKRSGDRATPVLLVVLYAAHDGTKTAAVCGVPSDPLVMIRLPIDRAARVCAAALAEPDRHVAARTLQRLLEARDQPIPGVVNMHLFALHELREGVPRRSDWPWACKRARRLLELRDFDLIRALGYGIAARGSAAWALTYDGVPRAIAVVLENHEVFGRPCARFNAASPVQHGLRFAGRENLPWLVVLRGTQLRLYPARVNIGVGRKGQTETYTELDLALLSADEAGYLTLLFSPEALLPEGIADRILQTSANYAVNLGRRLRERVYQEVVPDLAVAVAQRMNSRSETELAEAYGVALLILFRLLFVAYAEDEGLLPYGRNPRYDRRAIKALARDFADDPDQTFDARATSLWDGMQTLWETVDGGNRNWDVPPYNGGLFSRDPKINPWGAALTRIRLTDAEFGPALRSLLVDADEDGNQGPVDFRSLSVYEFGTIYQGLLESSLSIATTDLTLDAKGAYIPARSGELASVQAGSIYFRNRSGQRKSTGSYFTKPFAVEHLLDAALEPALSDHLDRIEGLLAEGRDTDAAEAFFDFRVGDLAMGSGHFLVRAINRIEARFQQFLSEHPVPAVMDELSRLELAARAALGERADAVDIERFRLLRRQIARRCIYGVDRNLLAVELARLAVWVHTFVPGLPMSALDHNLVVGDSLTGMGTVQEALDVLAPSGKDGTVNLLAEQISRTLAAARNRLLDIAHADEATKPQVREAMRAHVRVLAGAADAKALFDAAVAVRLGLIPLPVDPASGIRAAGTANVRTRVHELQAAHLPYLFPEVFLGERPGFDVLLGNPPWDKLQTEEHSFYALHFPGLRGLQQHLAEQEIARIRRERPDLVAEYQRQTALTQATKTALVQGPYPGLTAGRPDLYKAFAWRIWQLTRTGGYVGMVLPRKALEASGMAQWRRCLLSSCTFRDVTTLTNSGGWVFDDVHGQYTVALVSLRVDRAQRQGRQLPLRGPYTSVRDYRDARAHPTGTLAVDELLTWSDSATFPLLPSPDSLHVFLKIRKHPRLDHAVPGWSVRGLRELNATDDKEHFTYTATPGRWPVYKGESFDLWNPQTGLVYAWADPDHIVAHLQRRRVNQIGNRRSAFYGLRREWASDPRTLPCVKPRIAWRDAARATDTRTVIAALVPPQTILVHQAYYLFWREGGAAEEAYTLGILCSVPFDWYARQMVESHVTIEFMRAAPVPRAPRDQLFRSRVAEIACRLAAADYRYEDWASEAGVPIAAIPDDVVKRELVAELDALASLLYGLDRDEVEHIFATFHRGWDYEERLTMVLRHYDQWRAQVRAA